MKGLHGLAWVSAFLLVIVATVIVPVHPPSGTLGPGLAIAGDPDEPSGRTRRMPEWGDQPFWPDRSLQDEGRLIPRRDPEGLVCSQQDAVTNVSAQAQPNPIRLRTFLSLLRVRIFCHLAR